ncbi:unnamed protein product [Euphydryas editha]|uniref:DDE Tnp4 domain-containing protein n=1 Tax=Euphydryas editha TaxID=104508 RepID=A0AAU9VCM3_EUPED|nr:unnamed protein product [Euphydryas editha]
MSVSNTKYNLTLHHVLQNLTSHIIRGSVQNVLSRGVIGVNQSGEENVLVSEAFQQDPTTSIRVVAAILDQSIWRMWSLLGVNNKHAFCYIAVQALESGDPIRRLAFRHMLLECDMEDAKGSRMLESFMEKFRFPGVIDCIDEYIDGTYVALIRPKEHEETYFNRKNYYSLNVLLVYDAKLTILHVDASFGGTSHDSYVWNQCVIKAFLEGLERNGEHC